MNFQIGAYSGQNFQISIGDLTADALGFGRGSGRALVDIDITSITGANEALDIVDEALDQVNRTRSLLGAATNRLEATISNITVSSENLTASESRLRDADVARESTEFTRNQVLMQAGISVLAQANFTSQGFLALLG
jgi:flagellin